jgi:hypothetical protein
MLLFVSQVNNFFFVSRKFFAATVSRFLKARGAFMLPFAFEVNNFFPFRETFCFTVKPVAFFNREERLCSPSLSKSTTFFRFVKLFVSPWKQSFSSIARSVYAPLRFRSQPFFSFPRNFVSLAFP